MARLRLPPGATAGDVAAAFRAPAGANRKPAAPLEADIQRQCLDFLVLMGALPIRVNSAAFAVGEGCGRRFIRANNQPGCSDAIVQMPDGTFAAIEFKRPGGKLTDKQASFLGEVRKRNGLAIVADSVESLREQLRAEGYEC